MPPSISNKPATLFLMQKSDGYMAVTFTKSAGRIIGKLDTTFLEGKKIISAVSAKYRTLTCLNEVPRQFRGVVSAEDATKAAMSMQQIKLASKNRKMTRRPEQADPVGDHGAGLGDVVMPRPFKKL